MSVANVCEWYKFAKKVAPSFNEALKVIENDDRESFSEYLKIK